MTGGSAVFVNDDEGRYLAVNDAAIALLGYSREEFAALNARDVSVASEDELAEVYAMLKRGRSVRRIARLRRKDGVTGAEDVVAVRDWCEETREWLPEVR